MIRDSFKFHKRGQLFLCTHNETVSVTICVRNHRHSPVSVKADQKKWI
jgi:hypothetical protein